MAFTKADFKATIYMACVYVVNLSGVLLLDVCARHRLSITNTMFRPNSCSDLAQLTLLVPVPGKHAVIAMNLLPAVVRS